MLKRIGKLFMVTFIFVLLSTMTLVAASGNANTVGNSNSNCQNNSYVAEQGDWVYYSDMYNSFWLYKMRTNGTERTLLTTANVDTINVVGDWVYYENMSDSSRVYRIKTDGTKETKLNDDKHCYDINVIGDWVYYTTFDSEQNKDYNERIISLYKMKTDGTQKTLIIHDKVEIISIEGGWIYYLYGGIVNKVKADGTSGTGQEVILQYYNNMIVEDGYIYSIDNGMGIVRRRAGSTDAFETIFQTKWNHQVMGINISNGWIYYSELNMSSNRESDFKYSFYKMRVDGTEKTVLLEDKTNRLNALDVCGNWIYFIYGNEGEHGYLYRIKTDGSEIECLAVGMTFTANMISEGVKLDWSSNNIYNVIGYRMYRSETSGKEGIPITDFPISDVQYVDVLVEPDKTYYYTIRPILRNWHDEMREELGLRSKQVRVETVISKTMRYIIMELNKTTMQIDGATVEVDPGHDTKPINLNGRVMVPVRCIVEAVGGTVDWDDGESKITVNANGHIVIMWLNKREIIVDGETVPIDITPQPINGRTMVPVRFLVENIGYEIIWNISLQQIIIEY